MKEYDFNELLDLIEEFINKETKYMEDKMKVCAYGKRELQELEILQNMTFSDIEEIAEQISEEKEYKNKNINEIIRNKIFN